MVNGQGKDVRCHRLLDIETVRLAVSPSDTMIVSFSTRRAREKQEGWGGGGGGKQQQQQQSKGIQAVALLAWNDRRPVCIASQYVLALPLSVWQWKKCTGKSRRRHIIRLRTL